MGSKPVKTFRFRNPPARYSTAHPNSPFAIRNGIFGSFHSWFARTISHLPYRIQLSSLHLVEIALITYAKCYDHLAFIYCAQSSNKAIKHVAQNCALLGICAHCGTDFDSNSLLGKYGKSRGKKGRHGFLFCIWMCFVKVILNNNWRIALILRLFRPGSSGL